MYFSFLLNSDIEIYIRKHTEKKKSKQTVNGRNYLQS